MAHVSLSTYIDVNEENNKEDPKFKVCRYVKISAYKNIFTKSSIPNRSEEVVLI